MGEYINYKQSYPNLEKALRKGANIRVSWAHNGLRLVWLEKKGKLISYGEYPYFSGALAHAESDFGLSYEEQYHGKNAKHKQYFSGAYPLPHDIPDLYVLGKDEYAFDIRYSKKWGKIICIRPSNELPPPKKELPPSKHETIIWGIGISLLSAITDSFINGTTEDKELFMKRYEL